ncbi:MAG TPA: DegT/DnrJ/EryC1/StrS family aminotransferase, partial [Acidimicrobiia bacterium]
MDRERVRAALRSAEIGHDVYYPKATHQQEPYSGPVYDLPVTELMVDHVVSIPVRPDLTDGEIDLIVDTLNKAAT